MSDEIKDNEDIHADKEINHDNDKQSSEIDQPLPSENGHAEDIVKEPSTEDKQESESSFSTPIEQEISLEPPYTDIIIENDEKEEESTSAAVTTSEDTSLVSKESHTPVNIVRTKSINQSDDTDELLQTIADKSNKEASSAILNTVS